MSRKIRFKFRLYVMDDTVNSALALGNLKAFCEAHLAGRHHIEVVDLFRQPERALADGIMMTPALIVRSPHPVRTIIGTLAKTADLLMILGLENRTA